MIPDLVDPEDVIDALVGEGFREEDVRTAYDSLIDAGIEWPNDTNALSPTDIDVLRRQLQWWADHPDEFPDQTGDREQPRDESPWTTY